MIVALIQLEAAFALDLGVFDSFDLELLFEAERVESRHWLGEVALLAALDCGCIDQVVELLDQLVLLQL